MNAGKLSPSSFLLAASALLAEPNADLATYDKHVLPLLQSYCMDCHDADTKKGVISERRPLVFDSAQRQAIKLWDLEKGEELKDLTEEYKKHYLSALDWSPDGETIAVGKGEEADGIIWLLDAKDGKQRKKLDPVHRYGVTDFAFHPDGKHLFSCGRDTVIRIWDFREGKLVKELGKPRGGQFKDWIHAISLNHDGTLLAAADMAGQVNLWRLA